jgi:Mn-containing catalase
VAQSDLAQIVNALTPEQQAAVREFIEFLHKREKSHTTDFLAAVDEFIREHPELLRPLAQ